MERWYILLNAHDYVWQDQTLLPEVRSATCSLLLKKMLELEDLKPLPKGIRLIQLLDKVDGDKYNPR